MCALFPVRSADGSPVGEQGTRGVRHSRATFEDNEFSYASASKAATDLSLAGLPPQIDGDLMVTQHSLLAGHNVGSALLNQVQLDVLIFMNSGTWVEESGALTKVSCGHAVVTPSVENWHMCGTSSHGQDGCMRGELGVAIEIVLRFTDTANWATGTQLDSRFLGLNTTSNMLKFDADFAAGNIFSPSAVYVHADLWTPPGETRPEAAGSSRRDLASQASGNLGTRRQQRGRAADTESKVTICHVTASTTNPYTLIQVDESALPAHEAHEKNGNRDVIPAGLTGCSTSAWTNNDASWTLAPKPRDFAEDRCACALP